MLVWRMKGHLKEVRDSVSRNPSIARFYTSSHAFPLYNTAWATLCETLGITVPERTAALWSTGAKSSGRHAY